MTKFARVLTASAFTLAVTALAQTGSSAAALPAAPSAASAAQPTGVAAKIGVINIEQAIFASNEGQREFEALSKKFEPQQTKLKGMSDELESLKKQLNTQGDKLNEDARNTLVRDIDVKQKAFDRSMQDTRDDFQTQQNEVAQKILQKMAPVFTKYAAENGFALILDTSNPWPQGPVIWTRPDSVDITKAVVEAYNVQSGVAAPSVSSGARPATATRPAGTSTTKPASTGTSPK